MFKCLAKIRIGRIKNCKRSGFTEFMTTRCGYKPKCISYAVKYKRLEYSPRRTQIRDWNAKLSANVHQ